MSSAFVRGSTRSRGRSGPGLVLALVLTATLVGPAALAGGTAGADEPDATLRVELSFTHHPADAAIGQIISSEPFAGEQASPVTVAATVTAESIAEVAAELGPAVPLARAIGAELDGLDLELTMQSAGDRLGDGAVSGVTASAALGRDGDGGFEATLEFDQLRVAEPVRAAALEALVAGTAVTVRHGGHGPFDVDLAGSDARSERFSIWQEVGVCSDGPPCTARVGSDQAPETHRGLSAELRSRSREGFLSMTFTDEGRQPDGQARCGDDPYVAIPGPVLFEATGLDDADGGVLAATVDIDKQAVQADVNNGRAHYDICYVGDKPFDAKDGHTVEAGDGAFEGDELSYGPALLPTCGDVGDVAPCVASRTGFKGGGARIVVVVPAGDPIMR